VQSSRFSRWVGTANWQYFPEESTNPEKSSTIRLSDESYEIMLQKVTEWSHLNAVFSRTNANFQSQ
jgi:hypothetical protein